MKILYTSLFPKELDRHELENFHNFLSKSIDDDFTYSLFTAHKSTYDLLKKEYKVNKSISVHLVNFEFTDFMNERRINEISYCKERITWFHTVMSSKFDYIFFVDADIQIEPKDVVKLCENLKQDSFVNIPYVQRHGRIAKDSFGIYIISSSILLHNPDLYKVVYPKKFDKNGLMGRSGAPDCNIYRTIKKLGYKEVYPTHIRTKHYLNNKDFLEFAK